MFQPFFALFLTSLAVVGFYHAVFPVIVYLADRYIRIVNKTYWMVEVKLNNQICWLLKILCLKFVQAFCKIDFRCWMFWPFRFSENFSDNGWYSDIWAVDEVPDGSEYLAPAATDDGLCRYSAHQIRPSQLHSQGRHCSLHNPFLTHIFWRLNGANENSWN